MKILNKTRLSLIVLGTILIASVTFSSFVNFKADAAGLKMPGKVLGVATSAYVYPSGSLVSDNGTIYFINGTVKIPFTNFDAFSGLGYSLKNVIKGDLSNYTAAKTYFITSADQAHPWGSYILYNGTVYYSHESGLIPVPSWNVFLSNGGKPSLLVVANSHDLDILHSQDNLPVLTNSDNRVYTQQITGTIQPSLLPNNSDSSSLPNQPVKVDCLYPAPPFGFHYEGDDTSTSCGKILVADSKVNVDVTPTLVVILSPTPTPIVTSSASTQPVLNSVTPLTGAIGSQVTLIGKNFTSTENVVNFGQGVLVHLTASGYGTNISFNIPDAFVPSCYYAKLACSMASKAATPGTYSVSVTNANGTSNAVNFTVTGDTTNCAGLSNCVVVPPNPTPTPTSTVTVLPTPTPTTIPACLFPISCAAPPFGYHYEGNGTCSCGNLVPDGPNSKLIN